MYICITNIDAYTGTACMVEPMANGPALPNIKGLHIEFENKSQWPTNVPLYYGTCDDDIAADTQGVVAILTKTEYDLERHKERDALSLKVRQRREKLLQDKVDSLNPIRWAQMSVEEREAAIAYRQKLLDIPQQPNFPWEVSWPNEGALND